MLYYNMAISVDGKLFIFYSHKLISFIFRIYYNIKKLKMNKFINLNLFEVKVTLYFKQAEC